MARTRAQHQQRACAAGLTTLKRRSEFLRIRKGARSATRAFVLEAKQQAEGTLAGKARFGFTVSREVGGAVERNRIRRRLKAAVRDLAGEHAQRDFDYVVIARRPALDCDFAGLVADLARAFGRVHAAPSTGRRKGAAGGK